MRHVLIELGADPIARVQRGVRRVPEIHIGIGTAPNVWIRLNLYLLASQRVPARARKPCDEASHGSIAVQLDLFFLPGCLAIAEPFRAVCITSRPLAQ